MPGNNYFVRNPDKINRFAPSVQTSIGHTGEKYFVVFLIFVFLSASSSLLAQCGTPIAAFPYSEDFEISNGNWTTGGVFSDWTWGAPSKPVINGAGSGRKCWVTGGLTGSFYNLGEQSWLQSPCFDFSSVQHPYIGFQVFWETESNYDGATLEYSVDNGNTWQTAGSPSDPQNCLNNNWFNNPSISKLPAAEGWCGNVRAGNGSGTWVLAQHTMPFLAGAPKVIFRFFFGAGTVQNDFDGFAVDDIMIGEAPANNAAFSFNCTGGNTVSFRDASANCPDRYQWNFGDPGSGAANTSSAVNPSHTFSAAGTYDVTLTVSGPDNAPSTVTKKVSVISLAAGAYTSMLNCNGDANGSATVIASGGTGSYTYSWNTIPVQTTATAINLSAGSYTVTVTPATGCASSLNFTIAEPPKLTLGMTSTPATCTSSTGSVTATVTGGSGGYHYVWIPANIDNPSIINVPAGKYYLTVTDLNGCTIRDSIVVKDTSSLRVSMTSQTAQCGGSNGSVNANVSGGNGPYTYSWTPPNANSPILNNVAAGKYYLTVTDINGCTSNDSVVVKDTNSLALSLAAQPAVCGNSNGTATASVAGGKSPYHYSWTPLYADTAVLAAIPAGKYYVTVNDANGCLRNDSVVVKDTNTLRISLGKDTTLCQGDSFQLTPGSFSTYAWQDNSSMPAYTVASAGTYWVSVTDTLHCTASDTIKVVSDCGEIYFPTAFTPNGDGRNEYFGPLGNLYAITDYQLSVYNRWGQMVFQSTDPFRKWNGVLSSGLIDASTYTWFARFTYRDQKNMLRKGTVTIVR